jgi:adenine-specific DNA-methyltransferase
LRTLAPKHERFVDLFSGSGAVARYVATTLSIPVLAVDLMRFSSVIAAATIERTEKVEPARLFAEWHARAMLWLGPWVDLLVAARVADVPQDSETVELGRALCRKQPEVGFIWSDYGGYYFSPTQALYMSAYFATLPSGASYRVVALASLIRTASRASASPGHTAQPFRPTERLLPHLRAAWGVDIVTELSRQVGLVSSATAVEEGKAIVEDSVLFADHGVRPGDLVFCDPPYSEAQYSRFYHVLEGIARGGWESVHGAGRAPETTLRASSDFSRKTRAKQATRTLLDKLASQSATVLWTYPEGERSNGLTVDDIREYAEPNFVITETRIPMRHSTLGGSETHGQNRVGRRDLHEVLFQFDPRV